MCMYVYIYIYIYIHVYTYVSATQDDLQVYKAIMYIAIAIIGPSLPCHTGVF